MKLKSLIKFAVAIICLSFGIWLFIEIKKGFNDLDKGFAELLPSTYILDPRDSALFKKNSIQYLQVFEVLNSKVRKPIVLTNYKNSSLTFFSLPLNHVLSLQSDLFIKQERSDRSVGYTYRIIDQHNVFKMQVTVGNVPHILAINLSYAGDSLVVDKQTDSTLYLKLLCKSLSLKFNKEGPVDFHINSKNAKAIPLQILFLRKANLLYIFLLMPDSFQINLLENALLDLVNI